MLAPTRLTITSFKHRRQENPTKDFGFTEFFKKMSSQENPALCNESCPTNSVNINDNEKR